MNPLNMSWSRMRAHLRLFHSWIMVQLDLHWRGGTRLRRMLVKAADWLEATIHILDAQRRASNGPSNDITSISAAYTELLSKMADIRSKEHPLREDIEFVRGKFLGLLDLCGIKDADIPLFDEPLRVRGTRQTLITSFGIMSKSLNAVTPTRNTSGRPSRSSRNTGNYADMLIEHILANASPDSDSSPPSNEEERTTSGLSSMGSRLSPSGRPSHQRQRNSAMPTVNSNQTGSLSRHAYLALSDLASPAGAEKSNPAVKMPPPPPQSSLPPRQPTPDSGDPMSEGSHAVCSPSLPDSLPAPHSSVGCATIGNTSGSTPELPVSESSESLDIPNASLFDNLVYFERIKDFPNEELPKNVNSEITATPVLPRDSYYRFPTRYSHSYAKELQKVETMGDDDMNGNAPSSATKGTNTEPLTNQLNGEEPLVVRLPEIEPSTCWKCSNNEELPSEPQKVDFNINNNYKPLLEDKSALVSDPESPKPPPIPPRRPLTDSKVARLVLQFDNSQVGTLWSRQTPDIPQSLPRHIEAQHSASLSMTTGKAYLREKQRQPYDLSLADQHDSPRAYASESLSSSKRRKGNDRSALPVEHETRPPRPVRQRLFGSPHMSPSKARSPIGTNIPLASQASPSPSKNVASRERSRKKKHSPAMRRLIQQKESNVLSPASPRDSPRKPLSEIYNICLNQSDPLTTSSNSLTPSSDTYAKSSETSPDYPLPNREEELRDRDAHYCDFTVDRQHKIDTLSPKQRLCLYTKDVKENCYTLEDPDTKEILVRQVEGAESSPKTNIKIQAPQLNALPPRPVQIQPHSSTVGRSASIPVRSNTKSTTTARRSSSSSSSKSKSDHRRRSTRSSSRRSTNSHPMASSTIIEDVSPDTDDVASTVPSIYTWTIEEETEPCNLEKSYIRSKQALKSKGKSTTPRPPTSIGRDSPVRNRKIQMFEITAMVSEIDKHLNETAQGQAPIECNTDVLQISHIKVSRSASGRNASSGRHAMASAHESDDSASNSQASTSSMVFNRARASIQCSSNEPSDVPDLRQVSSVPSSSRTLSSSAPELTNSNASSHNAEAPDLMRELSILDERDDIPGKSSSSGSSPCTAARCRPRVIKPKVPMNNIDVDCMAAAGPSADDQPEVNQALIDSILTDSPKSVDSSGIFAPYNSYNSPAESVGSHNGYSSTVSSSVPSSDNYCLQMDPFPIVPPPTPFRSQSADAFAAEDDEPKCPEKEIKFKQPFNPLPHINHTLHLPNTRNRGMSAMASILAPRRPMSVRSDPLAAKNMFGLPSGLVTGPPKVSDKKSLVKKLKKFSTNFYKRNEKIRTLANL